MKHLKWFAFALLVGVGIASAQDTPLTLGVPVTGVYNGTAVNYSFQATAGQTILFEATSPIFDVAVEVYDATNYLMGDDNGGDGTNAAVGVTFPSDGVYTVAVLAYDTSRGGGEFTVSANPLPIVTDVLLLPGQTVRSVIGSTFPTFNVLLDRDMSILFTLLSFGFPPRIILLDLGDNVLQSTENNILLATLPAGAYRIRLEYASETTFNSPPYFAAALDETIVEPIGYGQTINRDDTGKRAAYFTFNAITGDIFNVRLQSNNPADVGASFTIYGPDGTIVFYSEGSTGLSYLQRQQIIQDGTYRIEVRPYTETFTIPYTLLLEQSQRGVLSNTPTQIILDGSLLSDTFNLNVEAGKRYRLTVRTDNTQRPLNAFIMNAMTQIASMSGSGANGISLELTVVESTTYQVTIRAETIGYDEFGAVIAQSPSNLTLIFEEIPQ